MSVSSKTKICPQRSSQAGKQGGKGRQSDMRDGIKRSDAKQTGDDDVGAMVARASDVQVKQETAKKTLEEGQEGQNRSEAGDASSKKNRGGVSACYA